MRMWMWGWSLAQLNCHLGVGWNVAIPGDWWMNFAQHRTAHSELLIRSENKSSSITKWNCSLCSLAVAHRLSRSSCLPAPRGLSWAQGGSSPRVMGCWDSAREVSLSSSLTLEVDGLGKIWMGLCDSKMKFFPVTPVFLDDNFMSSYRRKERLTGTTAIQSQKAVWDGGGVRMKLSARLVSGFIVVLLTWRVPVKQGWMSDSSLRKVSVLCSAILVLTVQGDFALTSLSRRRDKDRSCHLETNLKQTVGNSQWIH